MYIETLIFVGLMPMMVLATVISAVSSCFAATAALYRSWKEAIIYTLLMCASTYLAFSWCGCITELPKLLQ